LKNASKNISSNNPFNLDFMISDIQNVNEPDCIYVSPANSFGFMDGGIDMVYSRKMFPKVETNIKRMIAKIGLDFDGRDYLPIGCTLAVPTEYKPNQYMICAPTMMVPQNVGDTKNAYYAMYAILRLVHKLVSSAKLKIKKVYIPGLGTGIGGMSAVDFSNQVISAINDFALDMSNNFSGSPKDISNSIPFDMNLQSYIFIRKNYYNDIMMKQSNYLMEHRRMQAALELVARIGRR
jgi:O-acetyl-ADP-ribose deacetylase (regulator of RNase III)